MQIVKGGTHSPVSLCGCPSKPGYPCDPIPTTGFYNTQCCSADLEICNTNSDPYCGAC